MRRGVFLQVRLASTRLPGKALLPLAGKPVIVHAMEALAGIPADVHAILTDEASAGELRRFASPCGFEVFAGDPEDVLSRYSDAARHFSVDRYFRATGDNPLVSSRLAVMLEGLHIDHKADFSGFLGPPLGTGVEIVETEALFAAERDAVDPYEREHVSPYIYHHPERFRILRPWAPDEVLMPDALVTLDTQDDYEKLTLIYNDLYHGEPIETVDLVAWLRSQRAESDARDHLCPLDPTG